MQIISSEMFDESSSSSTVYIYILWVWAPPKLLLHSKNPIYMWWIGNWCRTFLVWIFKKWIFNFIFIFNEFLTTIKNHEKEEEEEDATVVWTRTQSAKRGTTKIALEWIKILHEFLFFFFLHVNIFSFFFTFYSNTSRQ